MKVKDFPPTRCSPPKKGTIHPNFVKISPTTVILQNMSFICYMGNNFVSDGNVCNTFCPVLQKLVDVGLKTF